MPDEFTTHSLTNMATNNSLLTQLADDISKNIGILTDYLCQKNLPQPSFDPNGPLQLPFDADPSASAARIALIDASKQLHTLAVGPEETTRYLAFNDISLLGALHLLCHFQIPQNIPLDGTPISISSLSAKTGLSPSLLPRFLRMAISNHYFSEPRPGFIQHTPWSLPLAKDEKMRAVVWFRFSELLPAVSKLIDTTTQFPDSASPDDTAFRLAFGDTFFGYKEKHPEHMLKFGQFVDAFSTGETADSASAIAQAYPGWGELRQKSLVVDVGGGVGHVSAAIAQAHPQLRFCVQDFEDMRGEAEGCFAKHGVEERVVFAGHNFFDPQPEATRGAAVYFLRNILHDWSDVYCRRILKPIIEAMGPESRIVVADIVQPEVGVVCKTQDARVRALDLTMLVMFNAKERSYEEWEALFVSVDERLEITAVVGKPMMKRDSLIEVRLRP